jgi:hypothetical protein
MRHPGGYYKATTEALLLFHVKSDALAKFWLDKIPQAIFSLWNFLFRIFNIRAGLPLISQTGSLRLGCIGGETQNSDKIVR